MVTNQQYDMEIAEVLSNSKLQKLLEPNTHISLPVSPNNLKKYGTPKELLNDYTVLPKIGEGGTGTVFKLQRRDDGSYAVLKAYSKYNEQIAPEIEIHKKYGGDHVLKAHGYFDSPGSLNINGPDFNFSTNYGVILELADGSVLNLLNRDLLPEQRMLAADKSAHSTLKFIEDMQKESMVHRDIKPENMMFINGKDGDYTVKVADFNTVVSEAEANKTEYLIGTYSYMSPEALERTKIENIKVDQRDDLYSLGVSLYHILTGQNPFEQEGVNLFNNFVRDNFMKLLKSKREAATNFYWGEDTPELNALDTKLKKILQTSIAEQTNRYQSTQYFEQAWKGYISEHYAPAKVAEKCNEGLQIKNSISLGTYEGKVSDLIATLQKYTAAVNALKHLESAAHETKREFATLEEHVTKLKEIINQTVEKANKTVTAYEAGKVTPQDSLHKAYMQIVAANKKAAAIEKEMYLLDNNKKSLRDMIFSPKEYFTSKKRKKEIRSELTTALDAVSNAKESLYRSALMQAGASKKSSSDKVQDSTKLPKSQVEQKNSIKNAYQILVSQLNAAAEGDYTSADSEYEKGTKALALLNNLNERNKSALTDATIKDLKALQTRFNYANKLTQQIQNIEQTRESTAQTMLAYAKNKQVIPLGIDTAGYLKERVERLVGFDNAKSKAKAIEHVLDVKTESLTYKEKSKLKLEKELLENRIEQYKTEIKAIDNAIYSALPAQSWNEWKFDKVGAGLDQAKKAKTQTEVTAQMNQYQSEIAQYDATIQKKKEDLRNIAPGLQKQLSGKQ